MLINPITLVPLAQTYTPPTRQAFSGLPAVSDTFTSLSEKPAVHFGVKQTGKGDSRQSRSERFAWGRRKNKGHGFNPIDPNDPEYNTGVRKYGKVGEQKIVNDFNNDDTRRRRRNKK